MWVFCTSLKPFSFSVLWSYWGLKEEKKSKCFPRAVLLQHINFHCFQSHTVLKGTLCSNATSAHVRAQRLWTPPCGQKYMASNQSRMDCKSKLKISVFKPSFSVTLLVLRFWVLIRNTFSSESTPQMWVYCLASFTFCFETLARHFLEGWKMETKGWKSIRIKGKIIWGHQSTRPDKSITKRRLLYVSHAHSYQYLKNQ